MTLHKVRYEVDPYNRLIIGETGRKSRVQRFRKVLDGKFKIGPKNSLIYHVKAPDRQGPDAPHQVKLRGDWSLTKEHNLKLTLDNWHRQTLGDELTLQGEIAHVEAHTLLFAVTTRSKDSVSTNILKLDGSWQANKHNQLTFRVKKEAAKYDTLTLEGVWELDKKHNLIYCYKKRRGKGKSTLTFRGRWDIKGPYALSYSLSDDSGFELRADMGRLNRDSIKYEVGVGFKPVKRTVVLYGKWTVKRETGAITFGLKHGLGKGPEMDLTLSNDIWGADGQAFLKLLKSEKEAAITAGIGRRW
ncbi:MAG: hypothetical protein PHR44_05810 [Candidatus Omnitrophica bacterium]|nr:hypothetical protein [Candidatus Omnitrophota bacterium]